MKKMQLFVVLFLVFAFSTAAVADMPPEPGQKRVSLSIIVEPADDFPEYRFFLKNGFDLKEYTLKKGEKVTISSMGGGALYRNGKFLAVPKTALAGLSEESSGSDLGPMQKAIADGKIQGTITLIDHGFVRDVPAAEAKNWKDPLYRLEKDGEKGVKAVLVSGAQAESKTSGSTGTYYSNEPKTPAFWATVAGGSLLTLALIFLGVYVLRRSKAGSANAGSLAK